MTKSELVELVANATGNTKKAVGEVIEQTLACIKSSPRTELRGFGVFQKKVTKPRIGRNPQTGAEITIKSRQKFVFKASK